MDVGKKAKEDIEYLFAQIDSVNVEEVKNEEVHLRLGNQVFKLVNIGNIDESYIENKIREEFREKLSKKLETIKRKINTKLNQMSDFVTTIKNDYETKEKDLKQQLRNAITMPNVTMEHAKKGLSVVRGGSRDSLVWLVQGVYWPKYVNHQAIEPEYSTKLITPIIILIKTSGNRITEVSVRKPIGLERFRHYHSFNRGECWGKWKYSERTWNNSDDIIAIAQEAQIVLENINANSPGDETPQGLPRLATLKRHLIEKGREGQRANINLREQRMGIEEQETHFDNANIWRT
jgi:hypothetical protein